MRSFEGWADRCAPNRGPRWSLGRFRASAVGVRYLMVVVMGMLLLLQAPGGRVVQAQESFCILHSPTACSGNFFVFQQIVYSDAAVNPLSSVDVGAYSMPTPVDLDNDGDVDLVVGAEAGNLTFYRNDNGFSGTQTAGDGSNATLTRVAGDDDPFANVSVASAGGRSAPNFADWNADGLLDLVVGSASGSVFFYVNNGTAESPVFVRSTQGIGATFAGVQVDAYSTPFAIDFDNDTFLDLIVGGLDGTFSFFDNEGNETNPVLSNSSDHLPYPVFDEEVDIGYSSTPFVLDMDNSGSLDIVAGSALGSLEVFYNTGAGNHPFFEGAAVEDDPFNLLVNSLYGTHSSPALLDWTGDGYSDLIVGDSSGKLSYFVLVQNPNVLVEQSPLNPFDGVRESFAAPELADLDSDGDNDLVLGTENTGMFLLKNIGSATNPVFANDLVTLPGTDDSLHSLRHSGPALADMNGDDLLDLVVGEKNGTLRLYVNVGNASVPLFNRTDPARDPFRNFSFTSRAKPATTDWDLDGDYDLAVGDQAGTVVFLENIGFPPNGTLPLFRQSNSSRLPTIEVGFGGYSVPRFLDAFGNGVMHLATGSALNTVCFFLNSGNHTYPVISSVPAFCRNSATAAFLAPGVGDLDGDSDVDLALGNANGFVVAYSHGRCENRDSECSGHGLCGGDTSWYSSCDCLLGYSGVQCADCSDSFYGSACDLCPGAGTAENPSLDTVCSNKGTCDDGWFGTGTCDCVDPFFNQTCSAGQCPAGFTQVFNETSGLFACDPCDIGTYKDAAGNSAGCSSCPSGTFANSTGQSACAACPPGRASSSTGSSHCSDCPAGRYAPSFNSSLCLGCEAGTFSRQDGASECTACAKGKFADTTGATLCTNCSAGTVTESKQQLICTVCDASIGLTTRTVGASSCDACIAGYFWDDRKQGCVECSSGMDCDDSLITLETLPLTKHHWRTSTDSDAIERCPLPKACKGGTDTGDDSCRDGYTGPLCSNCDDGYYYENFRCRSCSSASYSPGTIVVLIFLLAIAIALVRRLVIENADAGGGDTSELYTAGEQFSPDTGATTTSQDASMDGIEIGPMDQNASTGSNTAATRPSLVAITGVGSKEERAESVDSAEWVGQEERAQHDHIYSLRTKIKLIVSFFQVVTSFPFILNVHFPSVYGTWLGAAGIVNLGLVELLPMDCVVRTDFVGKLIVLTMVPIVITIALAAAYACHTRWCQSRGLPFAHLRVRYGELFILLTYLVFPFVSANIFRALTGCDKLDDGVRYMRADYSIECNSDRYVLGVVWASAMLFVYPLGIPLLYWISLWNIRTEVNPSSRLHPQIADRAREMHMRDDSRPYEVWLQLAKIDMREKHVHLATFQLLFESYLPRTWWWEVFESFRRLLLTSALIFVYDGTAVQVVCGCLIALMSVEMFIKHAPFVQWEDNLLAEVLQWDIFLILFIALLIRVGVTADDSRTENVFGVLLISLTVAAPLLTVLMVTRVKLLGSWRERQRSRSRLNTAEQEMIDAERTDRREGTTDLRHMKARAANKQLSSSPPSPAQSQSSPVSSRAPSTDSSAGGGGGGGGASVSTTNPLGRGHNTGHRDRYHR